MRFSTAEEKAKKVIYNRARIKSQRESVLKSLGNKCLRCGFSDLRALQIDHINGGGKHEMMIFGNGTKYYRRIQSIIQSGNGAYQLLCANCNCIKRIENNECSKLRSIPK